MNDERVLMAVIGAPHGVRGEVRVKTFTGDPMALGDYGPLTDAKGKVYTIAHLRPSKTVVVARIREITTREAAEAANGTELYVARSALPDDLDEDEFYQTDLIGLDAIDAAGSKIGSVRAMHDFGAGDIIELTLATGGTAMVPFTRAAVPQVLLADRRIVVDPAAAGLLPDEEEERP
ncbi:ribosome maturation factor RimM [Mesorhizobium sp. YIM 152430]|uniref:ribosome maturation factor RimM n=1 Tax=Mesorhizobium sp. YIM 152430 TaxID=3031761 RepID=UPI0023DAF6CD|nr:ribosome maturation factor RimM [Mesorhizobium sp. YIM 152430]MDF1599453.1 ribosome maturation factor RimM [Mesorhizobium sp. YIM 152430]